MGKLETYVPRHKRLGVCCGVPQVECRQDVVEEINVVDDDGRVVQTHRVIKSLPAEEVMQKYVCKDFALVSLLNAGVPLNVVNINHSNAFTIDFLLDCCRKLDSAETLVERLEAQRKERESWLQPDEKSVEDPVFES